MGLDMYLSARQYVSKHDWSVPAGSAYAEPTPNPLFESVVALFDAAEFVNDSDFSGGIYVDLPMGYWRKANAVHGYFVNVHANGVDECQQIYIGRSDLEDLLNKCKAIQKDPSNADELLPPTPGFFFGAYDIDDWYMEKIDSTVAILERCLRSPFEDYIYQASW